MQLTALIDPQISYRLPEVVLLIFEQCVKGETVSKCSNKGGQKWTEEIHFFGWPSAGWVTVVYSHIQPCSTFFVNISRVSKMSQSFVKHHSHRGEGAAGLQEPPVVKRGLRHCRDDHHLSFAPQGIGSLENVAKKDWLNTFLTPLLTRTLALSSRWRWRW